MNTNGASLLIKVAEKVSNEFHREIKSATNLKFRLSEASERVHIMGFGVRRSEIRSTCESISIFSDYPPGSRFSKTVKNLFYEHK